MVAGLAVAGCGSSKPTITKAQFVAKANAICSKANEKLEAAEKRFHEKPTPAELEAFLNGTLVPNIQAQINAVRALGTPSGEERTVTNMMNLAQTDLNKAKHEPTTLVERNAKPFANFAALAHRYGMIECATEE